MQHITVRRAAEKDIGRIGDLLRQINLVHHQGRPDIFHMGRKYTDSEVAAILACPDTPVLVAVDENDTVCGYMFGIFQQHIGSSHLTDIKTLYIDDLCVDEAVRGQHIGTLLYEATVALAKESGCYNLTLNVWSCNESAMKFYEARGLTPQKVGMEKIL